MVLDYGKRIKTLRERENVSQQQLATEMGIKRSSYNQFEQQYDIIPIKRLNQVANIFGVSIDFLLGLTDNVSYKVSSEEINMDVSSERLKKFRKDNGFTQNLLAEKLNISRSIIVYHENKRTPMGTPFLFDFCTKFNFSADYLLGKIDYMPTLKK